MSSHHQSQQRDDGFRRSSVSEEQVEPWPASSAGIAAEDDQHPHIPHDQQEVHDPRGRPLAKRQNQYSSSNVDSGSHTRGTRMYLPPTSSFSRSRSSSRSKGQRRRASVYPAAAPYSSQWAHDSRAHGYVPLPPPSPYVPLVQPSYHPWSQPLPYASVIQPSFIPPQSAPPLVHNLPNQTAYWAPFGATSRDRLVNTEAGSISEDHATSQTYVAVDPFRRTTTPSLISGDLPLANDYTGDTPAPVMVYPFGRRRTLLKALLIDAFVIATNFMFDTVPRQLYLYFLLRLPSFYFSRVARIFEEADVTMLEIKEMAVANVRQFQYTFIDFPQTVHMGPHMLNLKTSWEGFIDSLLREWKTLNIISVLLLSAILTILQIQGAGNDPLTRSCALFSLICALMSLLYGCMYIIRFGTMRKPHKAAEWAAEAQNSETFIWWNVWVLLAMPATWLAWSIIFYIACIMSFVWRAGTTGQEPTYILSPRAELGVRIAISAVLALGVMYFALVIRTFWHYGDAMDKSFKARVALWAREQKPDKENYQSPHITPRRAPSSMFSGHTPTSRNAGNEAPSQFPIYMFSGETSPVTSVYSQAATATHIPVPLDSSETFPPQKIMDLQFQGRDANLMPELLLKRRFNHTEWLRFIGEVTNAWTGDVPLHQRERSGRSLDTPPRPQDSTSDVLERWNRIYFNPRRVMACLCLEYLWEFPYSPRYAIYLVDLQSRPGGQPIHLMNDIFATVPEGLSRIDVFDQPELGSSRKRILGRITFIAPRAQEPWGLGEHVHFEQTVPSRKRSPRQTVSRSSSSSRESGSRSSMTPAPAIFPEDNRRSDGGVHPVARSESRRQRSRPRARHGEASSLSEAYHTMRSYHNQISSPQWPGDPNQQSPNIVDATPNQQRHVEAEPSNPGLASHRLDQHEHSRSYSRHVQSYTADSYSNPVVDARSKPELWQEPPSRRNSSPITFYSVSSSPTHSQPLPVTDSRQHLTHDQGSSAGVRHPAYQGHVWNAPAVSSPGFGSEHPYPEHIPSPPVIMKNEGGEGSGSPQETTVARSPLAGQWERDQSSLRMLLESHL